MQPGIALVSDISLGLFLTMALMGLRLWELQPAAFITAAMLVQIALVIAFVLLIVFGQWAGLPNRRGVRGFRRYCAGSTATAIANMTAVTQGAWCGTRGVHCGALVCGFVIDIANALVINLMAG